MPVVDDAVAFAAVDDALDVRLGVAGDADEGVDVGALGELDRVVADGGAGAVDDEGRGLRGGEPRLGEAEFGVEAAGGCEGGEGKGGALCERGQLCERGE